MTNTDAREYVNNDAQNIVVRRRNIVFEEAGIELGLRCSLVSRSKDPPEIRSRVSFVNEPLPHRTNKSRTRWVAAERTRTKTKRDERRAEERRGGTAR